MGSLLHYLYFIEFIHAQRLACSDHTAGRMALGTKHRSHHLAGFPHTKWDKSSTNVKGSLEERMRYSACGTLRAHSKFSITGMKSGRARQRLRTGKVSSTTAPTHSTTGFWDCHSILNKHPQNNMFCVEICVFFFREEKGTWKRLPLPESKTKDACT